jgi:hypothetical protein
MPWVASQSDVSAVAALSICAFASTSSIAMRRIARSQWLHALAHAAGRTAGEQVDLVRVAGLPRRDEAAEDDDGRRAQRRRGVVQAPSGQHREAGPRQHGAGLAEGSRCGSSRRRAAA